VLAFLIVGPMIDLKNTFMMLGSFKKRFTARLILSIVAVCFVLALAVSLLIGGFYG
ncbi:MAG: permease, partial [Firmicutes bacterium]|nr:permease [Bacillota bacterium]